MATFAVKPLSVRRAPFAVRASRPAVARVVCSATKNEAKPGERRAAPAVAALVAMSLIAGAFVPDDAMAAKSSGRVGGSGFSARRAAPARSAAPAQ